MSRARLPLLVAAACLLVHGSLSVLLFPHEAQFTKYPQAAALYLAGTLPAERLTDFSPLYLYAHVLVQKLLPGSATAMQWLQLGAIALAAGSLFQLLMSLLPLSVALLGTGLFIFSPEIMTYACVYEPEAFLMLFLVLFVYFAMQEGLRCRFLAGVFLALCLLLRQNFLPLLFLAPLTFYLRFRSEGWRRGVLVFVLPTVVALLLLSARNAQVLGTGSPSVMNPGYVFFEGNNPLSSGQSAVYPPLIGELKNTFAGGPDTPHILYRELSRRLGGRDLSIAEVNSFWTGKALNFISDYPGRFFSFVTVKFWFVLHEFRRFDLEVAYAFAQRIDGTWVPAVPFSLLVSLGIAGGWAWRHRWRVLLLPSLVIVCQCSVMLCFYVSDRQRMALIPPLVLLAGCGMQALLNWPWRLRVAMLAMVLASVFVLSIPNERMRDALHWWGNYGESDRAWLAAIRLRGQGALADAATQGAASLAAAPWLTDASRPAYLPFGEGSSSFARKALAKRLSQRQVTPSDDFDLAMLMEAAGEWDRAELLLTRMISAGYVFDREFFQSSQPGFFLARISARRGDFVRAAVIAKQALARAPGDPYILALLSVVTDEGGYERALIRYFDEIDAAFLIGKTSLELGRYQQAVARLSFVVAKVPEYRRAWIYLAAAYAGAGDDEHGARLYEQVVGSEVDSVMLEEHIVALYRRRVHAFPDDSRRRFQLGTVLAHYGHLAEAVSEQKKAFTQSGDSSMRSSIQRLEAMVSTMSMDTETNQ